MIEENGITQGCSACKSIEIHGTRKSRVHSRKCCERYENWLAEQASVADLPREEIGDKPRDPSVEFSEFLEEFRPDPSVDQTAKPDDAEYSPSIGPASPMHCTSLVSCPMQEQRDLLVLLVEFEVDVDELGEKATLRIMDYSYWYFLEKSI